MSATARTSPASSPATRSTATSPTRRYGAYVGIAPEADLIAIKVADDDGDSTVLDVITALQFAVDHKDELDIRVVNLSVSSDTPGVLPQRPARRGRRVRWHAGIVVVVAAGNRGDAADAVHYPPGNDPYVISVGATDEVDTVDPGDDTLAAFSSRGITQDGVAKPDVLAPGAHIVAPLAMGSAFQTPVPARASSPASYLRIGGTSMAAPVVAGAAALLLQARPELNPDQVKALLTGNHRAWPRTGLGARHGRELRGPRRLDGDQHRPVDDQRQSRAQPRHGGDRLRARHRRPGRPTPPTRSRCKAQADLTRRLRRRRRAHAGRRRRPRTSAGSRSRRASTRTRRRSG